MKRILQLAGLSLALTLTLSGRPAKAIGPIQLPSCGDVCSPEGARHGCLTTINGNAALKVCECENGTWRC